MAPLRIVPPILVSAAVLVGTSLAFGQGPIMPAGAEDAAESESPAAPATTLLRLRKDDHVFSVIVEPGAPQVARRVQLRLDLATIPATHDPTFGDRIPVRDASLVAVLTSPGQGGARKQALHPLGGAGSYGLHWTPDRAGLWSLTVERSGGELPAVTFQIGVDVPTPVQNDPSLGHGPGGPTRILGGLDRATRGGGVVGPLTPVAAGPTSSSVMNAISEPAAWLSAALEAPVDLEAAKQALGAIREQAPSLPGTVPEPYKAAADDYERLSADMIRRLDALAQTIDAGDAAKAGTDWRTTLDQSCAQCHVKFWWGVSTDLSSWPEVRSQPWRR